MLSYEKTNSASTQSVLNCSVGCKNGVIEPFYASKLLAAILALIELNGVCFAIIFDYLSLILQNYCYQPRCMCTLN